MEVMAAFGTIFASFVALGIAVFSYRQSERREKKSREKEAIEKILTPIRKELDSFSKNKWLDWYSSNRWHRLVDKRLEFPLQYFWLDKSIKRKLENFDLLFSHVNHSWEQAGKELIEVISGTFRRFLSERGIQHEVREGEKLTDDNIVQSHWSGYVGGKHGTVTLLSLVMWSSSLSEYLEGRKNDREAVDKEVEDISFSIANSKMIITISQADKLLSNIEEEISKYPKINNYRNRWRELYAKGSQLINEIDLWLSSQ